MAILRKKKQSPVFDPNIDIQTCEKQPVILKIDGILVHRSSNIRTALEVEQRVSGSDLAKEVSLFHEKN